MLIQAGLILRQAKESGGSSEKAVEEAAKKVPFLSKLKGPALHLAAQVLIYIAGKAADPYVEPLFKPEGLTRAQVEATVKDAVRTILDERAKTAANAGVREAVPPVVQLPQRAKPRLGPRLPPSDFPGTLTKLNQELLKRHSSHVDRLMDRRAPAAGSDPVDP
jgi:hypothetical protein